MEEEEYVFRYLFQYDEKYHLVSISKDNEKHFENIDHILDYIYPQLFPDWKLIAWGNNFDMCAEYDHHSFISFILSSELITVSGHHSETISFNELFYEIEDELMQKVLNNFHTQFVMEDFEDDKEEDAYKFIVKHGPKSARKNLTFKSKDVKKK